VLAFNARQLGNYIKIRASEPLQILHMDITEYRLTDNVKVYIHIVADNFSRKPLGVLAGLNKSAILTCENLKNVYNNFLSNEKRVIIYTDGGSENRSVTETFILGKNNMEHRICQKDGHGSNSMIEAIIKKIKQCFIYPNTYTDFDDFSLKLEKAIAIYSQQMPLDALGGKTPNEAFYGINPYPTEVTALIKSAAYKRKNLNKYSDCL
jgi:putative transposase